MLTGVRVSIKAETVVQDGESIINSVTGRSLRTVTVTSECLQPCYKATANVTDTNHGLTFIQDRAPPQITVPV
ncbi:hypothetical protein NPIL_87321 [Nephila pilipes]|uniref:Uncharacterized protein n=1 Tax=Nephila pilipes TaxID=299642 RepID=A0A8X6UH73_NEPPI|nr:hypothetical protein NPIL_87321 [Nephila pilipes]